MVGASNPRPDAGVVYGAQLGFWAVSRAARLEVAWVWPFDGPGVQGETADVPRDFADTGDPHGRVGGHIFDQAVQSVGAGRALIQERVIGRHEATVGGANRVELQL